MSDYDRSASAWNRGYATPASAAEIDQGLRAYMLGVYNYMAIGLALTGLVALGVYMLAVASPGEAAAGVIKGKIALTPFGMTLFASPLKWVVMLAPLGFVLYFSFRINQMSAASARLLFFAFAATMGLSLSTVLLVFTGQSVARTFFITAATFGALSLFGYTTKKDLSAFGTFLIMALFGLIIASLVNVFVGSSAMQWAISVIGLIVFAGLTAWDTQMIKEMYFAADHPEIALKKTVNGALSLYLDFINMFQLMLNFTGQRE